MVLCGSVLSGSVLPRVLIGDLGAKAVQPFPEFQSLVAVAAYPLPVYEVPGSARGVICRACEGHGFVGWGLCGGFADGGAYHFPVRFTQSLRILRPWGEGLQRGEHGGVSGVNAPHGAGEAARGLVAVRGLHSPIVPLAAELQDADHFKADFVVGLVFGCDVFIVVHNFVFRFSF
jgi:hypothetical protein